MRKLLTVAAGLVVASAVSNALAGLILSCGWAAPGANPNTTWNDLSGSGYNFTNGGAVYTPADKAYSFGGINGSATDAGLPGTGDASPFNFETAKAGTGTPFTVVYYVNRMNAHLMTCSIPR